MAKQTYTKRQLKDLFKIKDENLKFHIKMGVITKVDELYEYDSDVKVDTDTVFKFYVNDNFMEETRGYADTITNTGPVKVYSKAEIEKLNKERKE